MTDLLCTIFVMGLEPHNRLIYEGYLNLEMFCNAIFITENFLVICQHRGSNAHDLPTQPTGNNDLDVR